MSTRSDLEKRLVALVGLTRRKSRYGPDFAYYVGDREVAHFHGDGRLDIRLTRQVIRLRKAEGGLDPRVTTRGPAADWASISLRGPEDIALALDLVEDAVRSNS